jgi:hypothetical protein
MVRLLGFIAILAPAVIALSINEGLDVDMNETDSLTRKRCPPDEFLLQDGFNFQWFTAQGWWIQQMVPVNYHKAEYNHCVSAIYQPLDEATSRGYHIKDKHYASDAEHNRMPDSNFAMCMQHNTDDETVGKFKVGPCNLSPSLYGSPYFVVAHDQQANDQGWILVTGGMPKLQGTDGLCTTGTGIQDSGIWIMSRTPQHDIKLLNKIHEIARSKGLDPSAMIDVDNSGCTQHW